MVAVEESLNAKKAHAKPVEHKCAMEVEKRQQLLAACWKSGLTASHQLATLEESLQNLQLKIAAAIAKMIKWRKQGTEAAEEI